MADGRSSAGTGARPAARGACGRGAREPRRIRRWGRCTAARRGGAGVTDLREKAVIAGIGETEYSKDSGRTELALACEAIVRAADDAGLSVDDIDGLVRFDMDSVDEVALTSHVGLRNLRWMSHTGYGGTGGNAVVVHAAAAIAAGLADTVVCYRALNERSGARYGRAATWMRPEVSGFEAFQMPWGMLTPAHAFGQFARRHMIEYGTTSEQFGACRRDAARPCRAQPAGDDAQADHARGPPGVADDRRPPAAVRLLHRERRRVRRHRHPRPTVRAICATRPRGSWARAGQRHRAPWASCSATILRGPSRRYTAAGCVPHRRHRSRATSTR